MAANKFHITAKGEPGVCRAYRGSCPLGGEGDHYATQKEAQQAYEKKMTEELLPAGASKSSLGLRDLTKLSRVSSDESVLKEAAERGTDRTFGVLAKNPNTPASVLVKASEKAGADARRQLVRHANFPLEKMPLNEFAGAYLSKSNDYMGNVYLENEAMTDAHVEELKASGVELNGFSEVPKLLMTNNKLSPEKKTELATTNSRSFATALKHGDFYPADRVASTRPHLMEWDTARGVNNKEYLSGLATWAGDHPDDRNTSWIAYDVATNPRTPSPALQELHQKLGSSKRVAEAVYGNPSASDEVKASIREAHPSMTKIVDLNKAYDGKARDVAVVDSTSSHPYGRNRGYSHNTWKLDPDFVKRHDLSTEDVMNLMEARNYNAGVSYDPETYTFKGSIDSTD